jgi:hypothetical protein
VRHHRCAIVPQCRNNCSDIGGLRFLVVTSYPAQVRHYDGAGARKLGREGPQELLVKPKSPATRSPAVQNLQDLAGASRYAVQQLHDPVNEVLRDVGVD